MLLSISFIWSFDSWSNLFTFAPELLLSYTCHVNFAKPSYEYKCTEWHRISRNTAYILDTLLVGVFSLLPVCRNLLLSFPLRLLQTF